MNFKRWQLPEGVEELLPRQARSVEDLRRRLLDCYASWGYELVMPPLVEFRDSLLINPGSDVDLQSFKVTDQLSGRTMAIRPDITTQAARIDAHSRPYEGLQRLCYAGSVLHTRAKALLASRCPIEIGAELFGDGSVAADAEIVCLMLETLKVSGFSSITLDLGHVGIFRSLADAAGLDEDTEKALFDALQRKSQAEVSEIAAGLPAPYNSLFENLQGLQGDASVLDRAVDELAGAPEEVLAAVEQLRQLVAAVTARCQNLDIYLDLAELLGYQYHTGLVFAAYIPGVGRAVANGGRVDNIGAAYGRGRPATGFSAALQLLVAADEKSRDPVCGIYAPWSEEQGYWQKVQELREQGNRVVCGLPGQAVNRDELACDQQLIYQAGSWQLQAF